MHLQTSVELYWGKIWSIDNQEFDKKSPKLSVSNPYHYTCTWGLHGDLTHSAGHLTASIPKSHPLSHISPKEGG